MGNLTGAVQQGLPFFFPDNDAKTQKAFVQTLADQWDPPDGRQAGRSETAKNGAREEVFLATGPKKPSLYNRWRS